MVFKDLNNQQIMSSGTYISSPFLFINLGCEMIYILLNRLKAQKIDQNKSNKIISDITTTVFRQKFISQMMLPQQALTVPALKDIFKRLAHSSIMKLDSSSMEKLFYLMLMTFKKQVLITSSPLELYTLTINHIQSVRVYTQSQDVKHQLHNVLQIFKQGVKNLTYMQYFWVKEELLSVLQNYQTRIVTFIEAKQQNQKGHIIYFARNSHNKKSIGTGFNHPDIQQLASSIKQLSLKPNNTLHYQNYTQWKTIIGVNTFDDCNNTSNYVSLSSNTNRKKQSNQNQRFVQDSGMKSMKQMLGIGNQSVLDFNFQLELFGDRNPGQSSKEHGTDLNLEEFPRTDIKSSKISHQSKIVESGKNKQIKSKIARQFEAIDLNKQEQQKDGNDLLAMMDD